MKRKTKLAVMYGGGPRLGVQSPEAFLIVSYIRAELYMPVSSKAHMKWAKGAKAGE